MRRLLATSPRYLLISLFCFGFNNALLIGLAALRLHYALCVVVSAMIMIPLSYVLHIGFTYRVAAGMAAFGRYAMVQLVNTPLALLLFYLFCGRGHLRMVIAAPIVTGLMLLWNFSSSFWAVALRAVPAPHPGLDQS